MFLYHDVTLEKLANDWYGGLYPDFTGIRRWPSTGRWLNLHPIGTAILMAPFFLAADLLSAWSNLPRDGFSLYYQHGAGLAGVAYFLLGLAILRRMLRQQFSDGVVLATLICITWGTNLFHYAVFDGTFSHAYAFFLVCVWVWLVERWWERPTLGCSLALGVVAGAERARAAHQRDLRPACCRSTASSTGATCARGSLELRDRWRHARGRRAGGDRWSWRRSSRSTNGSPASGSSTRTSPTAWGSRSASPHLVAVLFSTQKGLFFWSPILLLSVRGRRSSRRGRARALALAGGRACSRCRPG